MMLEYDEFSIESGKTEHVALLPPNCGLEIHDYPDQDFAVGPRVCELCGKSEY